MRRALLEKLTDLMRRDRSVYVLTADTGFHVFDEFQREFADRYLNVGISEAAMISMASGLAHEGKQVFVYGIVPFVTMRCFEQIRVDLAYPSLPVKIVGVGGGLTYGPAGMTHHAIEDIALMRCLPNMTVVAPGDPVEAGAATEASMELDGPCYLRLGKTGEPVIHQAPLRDFAIGRGIVLREGGDVALVATGNMLPTAVEAGERLRAAGIEATVVSMHTVKPLDAELIERLARRCGVVATVEEHSTIGGLGSAVADAVAEADLDVRLVRFALPDAYASEAGSQDYFRRRWGLTAEAIAERLAGIVRAGAKGAAERP